MIKKILMFAIAGILLSNCAFASDCEIVHKSVRFYEKQVKEKPNNVCSLYNLANEYLLKSKVQKSLDTYDKIIKINPKENRAYIQRAFIYMVFNNHYLAEHEYGRLAKNIPDSVFGNLMMAFTYENISDYENAVKYMSKVIELSESGISDYKIGDELEIIDSAQKTEPQKDEYKTYYNFRADYYEKMGRYEDAIADYIIYAESGLKDSFLAYVGVMECSKTFGNTKKAEEALQKLEDGFKNAPKSNFKYSLKDRIKDTYFHFKRKFYVDTLT